MSSRFADNTQTKPVDRTRLYGYAPGLRMTMSPRGSNLQSNQVPQGQLVLFKPRVDGFLQSGYKSVPNPDKPGENLLSYDGKHEYSGRHFAEAVDAKFRGGESDWGFRILECLTDLPYDKSTGWDAADEYFAVLHPKLSCEMGLEEVLHGPAGDVLNGGQPWPCPTCRINWLESAKCRQAMENSGLDLATLENLRVVLLAANRAGKAYAEQKLALVEGEIESGKGKTAYDDADRLFMKLTHKKAKHIEQAEIQNRAAEVQGKAIGQAVADALNAQKAQAEAAEAKAEAEKLRQELEALKKEKKDGKAAKGN